MGTKFGFEPEVGQRPARIGTFLGFEPRDRMADAGGVLRAAPPVAGGIEQARNPGNPEPHRGEQWLPVRA